MTTPTTMQQIADELAVRTLAAQFSDATNRRDMHTLRMLWLPDGVWDLKPPVDTVVHGVDAIVAMSEHLLAGYEFFVQMTVSGVIVLDGDRATARWCMHEVGRRTDGTGLNNFGLSLDEMIRHDGGWMYTRRAYQPIYFETPQFNGTAFPLPPDLA